MSTIPKANTGSNPVLTAKKLINMCCSNTDYRLKDINGECPDCGEPTVDGNAYDSCDYSPKICETCGWSPCDESC